MKFNDQLDFMAMVRNWLESKGVQVVHGATQYSHEEMQQLQGLLCHKYGMQPERIVEALHTPSLFSPALLAEITGAEAPEAKPVPQGPTQAELDAAAAAEAKRLADETAAAKEEENRLAAERETADRLAAEKRAAELSAEKVAEEKPSDVQDEPKEGAEEQSAG